MNKTDKRLTVIFVIMGAAGGAIAGYVTDPAIDAALRQRVFDITMAVIIVALFAFMVYHAIQAVHSWMTR